MLPFQAVEPDSEKKKKPLTPSHKSQPFFFFWFLSSHQITFVSLLYLSKQPFFFCHLLTFPLHN